MKSLSRRFLLSVGATSVSITLLGSIATFLVVRSDLIDRQVRSLPSFADQRMAVVSRRFAGLAGIQKAAIAKLRADMTALSDADVDRLFERQFPLRPDGTRRSRPAQFDGELGPSGERTYGMGAFLAKGAEVDPQERRALVAAYQVVREFGVGVQSTYDNVYFATPNNRVVMFAPKRPDRLLFYRSEAPASLDFRGEEMIRMMSPEVNARAETRCTSLQRLIQDEKGARLSTACLTPVFDHGRLIGGFGSSLPMTQWMPSAVGASMKGVTSLLVRSEGDVLAYPGHSVGESASPQALEAVERRFQVREVMKRVRSAGRSSGLVSSPDGRRVVAFGRIPGPNWWLLMSYSKKEVEASAMRSASWILGLGLLASLLQTLVIVWLARSTIAQPLRRLAETGPTEEPPSDLLGRRDEIGVLGRALLDERERTRSLLSSLETRVRERTAELERASSEKDRFLANMSHELRTPLNGVIAVSETLAGLQRSRRAKEMAQLIVNSGRLLEHVLSDILDFARLEAGEIALSCEPFDLELVLSHTAELHRAVAAGKRLTLTCIIDPAVQGRYVGDPVRITQVISNLLSNAVKFTQRGEVRLRAEPCSAGVRISVSDTGIGFDAEVGRRLFNRFEQADPSISRRFGGSGLGLAICRSLVDVMGGSIRAASASGAGSTFTVELPLERAVDSTESPSPASEENEAALAGVHVLLAEDHPTNQKVVELILEGAGVALTVVENGRAALEALNGRVFDLVLMDMQMPEMDGLTATRLWREKEALLRLPRTPVVMLTANALAEHVEASLAAGADSHVAKPIRAVELLETVHALTWSRSDGRNAAA